MTFVNSLRASLFIAPVAVLVAKKRQTARAKTAWPINRNFSTVEGEIAGRTEFLTAAWSDFVTYEVNGVRSGHVTPYALAKNYLEISVTNLFRQKLGIDHVDMQKPEWKNKVFFMRYQEINLDADFYDLLTCPRSGSGDYETVSLTVESKLAQVGGTSFLVNQELLVGDKKVGLQRMQICCVSTVERKSSKLPDSFVFNPDIQPYTKAPRPRFPTSFVSEDSSPVGAVRRTVFTSDIDENNHLNEAGYIRFIIDAGQRLVPTWKKFTKIKSIKGLYKQEIREGEEVQIALFKTNDLKYQAAIIRNGAPVFDAEIELHQ